MERNRQCSEWSKEPQCCRDKALKHGAGRRTVQAGSLPTWFTSGTERKSSLGGELTSLLYVSFPVLGMQMHPTFSRGRGATAEPVFSILQGWRLFWESPWGCLRRPL